MATFENNWYDPNTQINKGVQWSPYIDSLSVYDMNKIISNLNYLKAKVAELEAKVASLEG